MHCCSFGLVSENFHHLIILHLVASPQSLAFACLYQSVLMTEPECLLYTCSLLTSLLVFNPPNTHKTWSNPLAATPHWTIDKEER